MGIFAGHCFGLFGNCLSDIWSSFTIMRIWHEKLVSKLCRQHLLAMWRESHAVYSIIVNNKTGYAHHPAVLEFVNDLEYLKDIIEKVQQEMFSRHYHPKDLPWLPEPPYGMSHSVGRSLFPSTKSSWYKPWQTLEQQIKVLRAKKCDCRIST